MTERDKIVGDIFRNNLYSWNNIPAIAENIGKNIAKEFDYSDFLMQSLATQLIIAANIRKKFTNAMQAFVMATILLLRTC